MRWFLSVLVVLAILGGLWWMEQERQAELVPEPDVDIPTEPEPHYPLPKPEVHPAPGSEQPTEDGSEPSPDEEMEPAPEPQPPLPDLADSDAAALEALSGLLGNDFTQRWLKPEFVISRTVAIVNSLDDSAPALKTRPLEVLDSEPLTREGEGENSLLWSEANTDRYQALVDTLESVPPERAAALYRRYHPLFQQAWEELGENEPYFNDRLIDIIDHLLATPEVELPFEVTPHEGRLLFADESLQEQPWGRKLLIRMGESNRDRLIAWLRQFRSRIAGS